MSVMTKNCLQAFSLSKRLTYTNNFALNFFRFTSNNNKDLKTNAIQNQDILYESLKHTHSTDSVFDLVASHHKMMNNKHLMQAFRSLFNAQKHEKFRSNEMITSRAEFKKLCLSLKSQVRLFEINEIIEAIKILSYVGVQSNSTIMQILLQIIRANINELSLHQIIFLEFLLKQFKSTPLSEALLIAFPIVFEAQLPMKIDKENMSHLSDLLQYSAKNRLNESIINYLLDAIGAIVTQLELKSALSIVWSICDLRPKDSFEDVFRQCLDVVVRQAKYTPISISDLETTLSKLSFRYGANFSFFYHKDFFDMTAERVIKDDVGFQQSLWILHKFAKLGYTNTDLLDYISTLGHNDLNLISKASPWNLFILVRALSGTNYKPIYWESVRQGIFENEQVYSAREEFNWIKFAARLAILDCFIPKVLERAFRTDYLEKLLAEGTYTSCQYYSVLYQTISILQPEYTNLLPDVNTFQQSIQTVYANWTENHVLRAALERAFGGKSYVLSKVMTKFGHLLHHVVVMRKGSFAVSFQNRDHSNVITLDELELPDESHMIAIIGCDSNYYNQETAVLREFFALQFRTIEATGCSVIPINLDNWLKLPDFEKIPYLMQTIRFKNEQYEKMLAIQ